MAKAKVQQNKNRRAFAKHGYRKLREQTAANKIIRKLNNDQWFMCRKRPYIREFWRLFVRECERRLKIGELEHTDS